MATQSSALRQDTHAVQTLLALVWALQDLCHQHAQITHTSYQNQTTTPLPRILLFRSSEFAAAKSMGRAERQEH